jgi:hypothetical protein
MLSHPLKDFVVNQGTDNWLSLKNDSQLLFNYVAVSLIQTITELQYLL